MVMEIAAASIGMSSSKMMAELNTAMLGKALETAQIQGEALQEMLRPAAGTHRLDTYA